LIPFLLAVGLCDLSCGKIPNYLTFPVIISGIILNAVFGGVHGFIFGISGFTAGFLILLPFYILGGIGGGDIKFLAGIGAIKGYMFIFQSIVYFSAIALLMAIIVLLKQKALLVNIKKAFSFIRSFIVPSLSPEYPDKINSFNIPYGTSIALGAMLVLLKQLYE
jgi:prepilin peptidase CpaA